MQMFPYYLSLGCSYNEFWNESPWIAASYYEAAIWRKERTNYELWLQGLYVYEAVMAALGKAFWNKKGQKPENYPEYPHAITDREKEADKQRRIERTLKFIAEGQK